ncbi:MAG: NADH-quinone oxidoreductase subunit A [Deltaproteobacteria bacterium RBG_13_61_14]|nr:MAG: NADH-quinone oxidoreductase subunit A [Deltaproteobacteria bacterium RBG_13_61_14]
MLLDYIPVLALMAAAAGLALAFTLMSELLGPKRRSAEKQMPFECGNPSSGNPKRRFSVKFYPLAVLFLLLDIEAVFLYPWATIYRELSQGKGWMMLFGFAEMGLFIALLALALFYAWKKGALEWD